MDDNDFEIIFSNDENETIVPRDNQRKSHSNNSKKQTTTAEQRELKELQKAERQANRLFRETRRIPLVNDTTNDEYIWSERALNWHKYQSGREETERLKRVNRLLDK